MGARSLFIGTVSTISICLVPGIQSAQAQTAPGTSSEVLPAIEVVSPGTGARPARNRNTARATRNVRRVFVYPTSPTPTAGSGMDVDKVPSAVNAVGARQIERTGSLNIADALQQQVPGDRHQRSERQSISARHPISRVCRIPGLRYAAGTGGLPERHAHQRGLRRHRQLGSDSDRRDQVGHRRDQQSRFRTQCAGRGGQRADEGWLQLSGRRDQHDGRLVRPHPELGAMGKTDRQLFRLRRARRIARRRFSKFFGVEGPPFLWRRRLSDRQQRIPPQYGRRQ